MRKTGIPCDITVCPNDATWAFIGEGGDLYLCADHFNLTKAHGWSAVPDGEPG